jgi:hypothetical protein
VRAQRHMLGRVGDRAAVFALFVPMWRIGFLIIADRRGRPSGKFRDRYDFAAVESQIEFGEATIMETNELIGHAARKLAAPQTPQV